MLLNRVNVATATAGTGAAALGAAASSFQTWAGAGAVDGQTYSYLILDTGGAWELGRGVYSSGANTLTRPGPGADASFRSSTGLLLALSGAATIACVANVLDYAVGGGAGAGSGRVLLQDVTVTGAQASVILNTFNATKYLHYQIEVSGGLSDAEFRLEMSTDGGATFDTSGLYDWSETVLGSGGYNNTIHGASDTSIQLPAGGSAAPDGAALLATIYDPGSTGDYKQVTYDGSVSSGDGNNYRQLGAGRYRNVAAVNAARLTSTTGNVNGGRFRLYGIPLNGTDSPLAGITSLHVRDDFNIPGAWTVLTGCLAVDHDPLGAYPADTGAITVPPGVAYARASAFLAYQNGGGNRLMVISPAAGGAGVGQPRLLGHMSSAPNEGLQSVTGPLVAVTPGTVLNIYCLGNGGGDHISGASGTNFMAPARFEFEWFSSFPGGA